MPKKKTAFRLYKRLLLKNTNSGGSSYKYKRSCFQNVCIKLFEPLLVGDQQNDSLEKEKSF
jgi:hypothetical protein